MPDFQYLYDLIKRGEDQKLDFKRHISDPQKIAKTIVAFANSEGGQIVIGVSDEGDITGVDVAQERFMMIKAGKHYCSPPVFIHFRVLQARGRQVLVAEVKRSRSIRHSARGDDFNWIPYVRVNDQTVVVNEMDDQQQADRHNLDPIPILLEENRGLVNFLKDDEHLLPKGPTLARAPRAVRRAGAANGE